MMIATIVFDQRVLRPVRADGQGAVAFVALAVAFITAPLIAWATDGKYYIARKPKRSWQNLEAIQCCICEHSFEPEDMASCPAYAGPICSLCCSLDARCHDLCKPHARAGAQVSEALGKLLPEADLCPDQLAVRALSRRVRGVRRPRRPDARADLPCRHPRRFRPTVLCYPTCSGRCSSRSPSSSAWWPGCSCWRNRAAARRSGNAAADRALIQEIDAHKRTDAELQRAKEVAESANLAKSRYVVGLSHELRSPLKPISGYAQLLEQDSGLATKPRDQVRVVRRSADHLSGLIDGILDISKIEPAGFICRATRCG
jgi:hypothetical protein